MRIQIASDHAGFEMKQQVKEYLEQAGHDVEDLGPDSEDSVDYPLFAGKVARGVAAGDAERGILVCGTGLGMSISANKVRGIRAIPAVETYQAEFARKHNDANVITLAGRHTDVQKAFEIVDTFLSTEFEGGRHSRRVGEITDLEEVR